ncbi:NADH-quinone oxidoreductase subunit J family protein [Dongshaea marina]|uniref:NADH-quinone oxidoreductase subunit J family protein n=1 Tax=Dongshaea marina TaxID=2047966 RepID=UPI000D3E1DD4|nr:NADH-quinone oxidoreductase subunit J [Dongshaea marina]
MILWSIVLWLACAVSVVCAASLLVVQRPMHGAVYLTTCMLALALVFYLLGAPFLAMMQIILYVGAIMVLFVFFIMLSPLDRTVSFNLKDKRCWLPLILLILMVIEAALIFSHGTPNLAPVELKMIGAHEVGALLFGHYKLAVELVSTLLLAAMVAVIYFARHMQHDEEKS